VDGFDLFLEIHVDADNLDTFSERSEFEDGRYIIACRPCFVWEDLIIKHQWIGQSEEGIACWLTHHTVLNLIRPYVLNFKCLLKL
jgi:hypothetical protein